ncbi:unnamed protein product [Cladocopium goreaui]|uniref:Inactive glycosyltransferase 25 family member 3 n=1 Tax=Cladocopium goreaui TaxID=2562237 RepID=A0A9P1BID6_9DINO|nr:unnamed protein product [Cladocopium goreaui]
MRAVTHVALCMLCGLLGYQIRQVSTMRKGGCRIPRSWLWFGNWSTQEPPSKLPRRTDAKSFLRPVASAEVSHQLPKLFHCDPLEHVIAINLEDDRGLGRRGHMIEEFKRVGIKNYNFFPAVDFKNDAQLKREEALLGGDMCKNPARCHNTLGCAMSHRRVYEKILAERWPCAMIFEDDAGLADNFSARVAEMASGGMPPFDIVLMGWCWSAKSKITPPDDMKSTPELRIGWPGMCIHAYIMSIHGALMFAQANTPIRITPDAVMDGSHHHLNRTRTHISRAGGQYTGSYWYTEPRLSWQDANADLLGGGV